MAKKDKIQHRKVKGTEMVFRSLSLPAALVEELKLLRDCYEETWFEGSERERVTYEKVFERLLSKSGLGHADPDVYERFLAAKKSRIDFPLVVTRTTRNAVADLAAKAEEHGTSLKEEAAREQERAKAELEELRQAFDENTPIDPELLSMAGTIPMPSDEEIQNDPRLQAALGIKPKRTEKRFVHPDGRSYPAIPGDLTPFYAKIPGRGNVGQKDLFKEGFEIKDVEI